MRRHARLFAALPFGVLLAVAAPGCVGDADTKKMAEVFAGSGAGPDELPVMTNKQPPFRYPTAAYTKKIQGNTILRIFIDADGNVQPDSTTIAEASGTPALDSAAIVGARELHFIPAKKNGSPPVRRNQRITTGLLVLRSGPAKAVAGTIQRCALLAIAGRQ